MPRDYITTSNDMFLRESVQKSTGDIYSSSKFLTNVASLDNNFSINSETNDKTKAMQYIDEQISKKTKDSIEKIKKRYLKGLVNREVAKPNVAVKALKTDRSRENSLAKSSKADGMKRAIYKSPLREVRKVQASTRKNSVKRNEINRSTATNFMKQRQQQQQQQSIVSTKQKADAVKTRNNKKTVNGIKCDPNETDLTAKVTVNIKKEGMKAIKKIFTLRELIDVVQKHVLTCPSFATVLLKKHH